MCPANDALSLAMQERPEIRLGNGNIVNQAIAVRYASSLMKPTLTVFGVLGSAGLWGIAWLPIRLAVLLSWCLEAF
jgi:hypothetical protein